MDHTTICALSTPQGTGGLHLIRVSGPSSVAIVSSLFRPAEKASFASVKPVSSKDAGKKKAGRLLDKTPTHHLRFGRMIDPKSGETIDEVVISLFRAPHSFTGEDTVEISCHGGMYIVRRILEVLLENGCDMAEPGEFSKRAFLNGRMDLTEAEAVMDMISARTRYSLKAATQQLKGTLYEAVESIRGGLIDTLVKMEVNIDYPEYDVPEITDEEVLFQADHACKEVEKLIATSRYGKLMKNGIRAALVGSPNVGKSSLMNALLKEERAIVTEIPGTTRDTIEESVDLDGVELRLIDTAGIRETENPVERIGVERAKDAVENAELGLFIVDASRPLTEEEKGIYQTIRQKPHLILINKEDLLSKKDEDPNAIKARVKSELSLGEGAMEPILLSAKTGRGMEEVTRRVKNLFFEGNVLEEEGPLVTNLRQENALMKAASALERVKEAVGMPQDLLTIDLKEAADALGEVTGKSTMDEVITEIFSRFCLGK